ncbi:4'-phosphopantetheinyl transferase family protein [Streptomyces sp. NBC_00459]|uniref:4'-phosphopantetheinyl transferase family protein n=1 Tax=Streptomyces sp. NBC_00459 TaxID=2975749 RepID=UPI002E193C00
MSVSAREITQAPALTVGGTAVEVWFAETGPREVPEDGWGLLAPDDLRYLARLAVPAVRAEAAYARAVLRRVLGERLGLPPADIRIARTLTGRPYLPGTDWDFSLSYTAGLVAVAVGRSARIGVDVERVRPVPMAHAIADGFFTPADHTALAALSGPGRDRHWFQVWTRVEAIIKAQGAGLLNPGSGESGPSMPLLLPEGCVGTVAALPWNGGPG